MNTRKLYVYGPDPPVTYDAMVMVWPLSYVVATLGDIVGVVSAELTVIVPDKIEFGLRERVVRDKDVCLVGVALHECVCGESEAVRCIRVGLRSACLLSS